MLKAIIDDVFLTAILEERVKDKNNKHPVKIRISHKGKKVYYTLAKRFSLSVDEWNKLPDSNSKVAKDIKRTINDEFSHYHSIIKNLVAKEPYSHDKLKRLRNTEPVKSLSEKFAQIIAQQKADGSLNSASVTSNTKKSFESFVKGTLYFESITPKLLEKYENIKSETLSYTTIGIYMRTLKAVFNRGIVEDGVSENLYPFSQKKGDGKYRIPKVKGTKIALTIKQLSEIEHYQPTSKTIETSRDLFLLSFHLAGINFIDMLLLKWSDKIDNKITFVRQKTKETNQEKDKKIRLIVNRKAQILIDKLSQNSKGNYILPYLNAVDEPTPGNIIRATRTVTRLTNKHLKIISKELDISNLTTYVARHTFATISKNAGQPISFIQEKLGHSSINTTMNYLKGFETEQEEKMFDLLANITDNGKV
ncbi:MAG: site-specific integrase [Tenuifilaceae bacterium]|nr:site-specific integrase [Tenuifilaceae bacterium]